MFVDILEISKRAHNGHDRKAQQLLEYAESTHKIARDN